MTQQYIADSSVFIEENIGIPYNLMITTTSVEREMKSQKSVLKIELAKIEGLKIENSDPYYISIIVEKAKITKDIDVLSQTDIEILAKCLEYKHFILLTDDFAIQNLASFIGIKTKNVSLKKKIKHKIIWHKQCIGCKKFFENGDTCLICGSKLIKKAKNRIEI